MATWTPTDGYFGTLLAALLGGATRRTAGKQESGGSAYAGGGNAVTTDSALRLSAVWACIKLISEAVGAMPVNVYRVGSDGVRTLTTDHWSHELFNKNPNQYQTGNEFFETVMINMMASGNSYVRMSDRKRDGSIASLMSLSASQVEVILARGGGRTYNYTDGTDVVAMAQERVWHTMLMPSNSIVGLSPLQYGARTMGISIAAEDRVSTLAANGFKPTGVLMIDRLLKEDQRTQIRAQFADLAAGQGDPIKVLEAGMKYQAISISPKDSQLLESRRFSVEDIARFYGVPSVLINDTSASSVWGTGIGEIKEGFYTLTLKPILNRLTASMQRWVLSPGDRIKDQVVFDFDIAAFLAGSEAHRVETMTKAVNGKLLTIDEARKRFDGLPPLPGGVGDVMYDQMQMIPLGTEVPTDDQT